MERQNKTTLRKEYKGELYCEVLNENARCWGWGRQRRLAGGGRGRKWIRRCIAFVKAEFTNFGPQTNVGPRNPFNTGPRSKQTN